MPANHHESTRLPAPTSDDFGPHLLQAARSGALNRAEVDLGDASAAGLLGNGETYAAWLVRRRHAEPVVLRAVHRPVEEMPRTMEQEFAALRRVPRSVGTHGLAMEESADNPLGVPWMLISYAPGQVRTPSQWTEQNFTHLAQVLAEVHCQHSSERRGFVDAAEDWGPLDLAAEFDGGWEWWAENHPQVTSREDVADLHEAVRARLAQLTRSLPPPPSYALIHGDLVATNVVFDGARPHLIDWEWAEMGDVAKDLGYIGGTIHGGPGYVPMTPQQIEQFLATYTRAVHERGGQVGDEGDVRLRRDGWELNERFLTSLHYIRMAQQPDAAPHYGPAVAQIHRTLWQVLGRQ